MCAKFIDRRRILFKTNGASPSPSVIDWFLRPLFKTAMCIKLRKVLRWVHLRQVLLLVSDASFSKQTWASPNPSVIDWLRRPLFKTNYVRTVLFLIVLNWLS